MKSRQKVWTVGNGLTGVIMTVFLICLAVTITLHFRPLYYLDMKLLNISQESGYSGEEIRQNYDALIDYNSIFYSGELEFPTMPMSENARIHFEEVRAIFCGVEYAAVISFVLVLLLAVWNWRKNCFGWLKVSAVFGVVIPSVLGVLIALNWETVFITFHKLAFRNDYWLFSPVEDPVITILPDAFFMHCAILIVGLILAGSLICFGIYNNRMKKQK